MMSCSASHPGFHFPRIPWPFSKQACCRPGRPAASQPPRATKAPPQRNQRPEKGCPEARRARAKRRRQQVTPSNERSPAPTPLATRGKPRADPTGHEVDGYAAGGSQVLEVRRCRDCNVLAAALRGGRKSLHTVGPGRGGFPSRGHQAAETT